MKQKRIIIHSRSLDELVSLSLVYVYTIRLIGFIDRQDGMLAEVEIKYSDYFDMDKLIDSLSECSVDSPIVEKVYVVEKRVAGRVIDRVSVEALPFEVRVGKPYTANVRGEERKMVQMKIDSRFPHLADLILYEEDYALRNR